MHLLEEKAVFETALDVKDQLVGPYFVKCFFIIFRIL